MPIRRIYSYGGEEILFKQFEFPDGQRHIEFQVGMFEYRPTAVIEASLITPADVLDVLLASEVLRGLGRHVNLDIRYLTGARMDRRIGPGHPETLRVIAAMLRSGGFDHIRVLDPHSDVCLGLLGDAEAVYPITFAREMVDAYGDIGEKVVIIPDDGARSRVDRLLGLDTFGPVRVQCVKERDSATGKLSGFRVTQPDLVAGKVCLIFDDICDGGGTFVGLATKLREAGAVAIVLFVTHAIMSKGLDLEGIDQIYATDSFANHGNTVSFHTLPISMEGL